MNIKAFFVDALTSALELGIGTSEDVLRHITPDVLATYLPRPLWARLFTACLGAARVDAQLIVETIGIPNFCEHVPSTIIWACVAEIGAQSLGKVADVASTPASVLRQTAPAIEVRPSSERAAVLAPPPDERPTPAPAPVPIAVGPSIPAPAESLTDVVSELETGDPNEPRLASLRPRSPTAQRFRQSNTGAGRIGNARRPQAAAVPTPFGPASSGPTTTPSTRPRREMTEVEPDAEPEAEPAPRGGDEWRQVAREIAVDDSQLVDWQATDGAGANAVPTVDEDFSDLGRKR